MGTKVLDVLFFMGDFPPVLKEHFDLLLTLLMNTLIIIITFIW